MKRLHSFSLPADFTDLAAAGDDAAALLEAHGADAAAVYAARVAIEELGTNVIKYAYPAGEPFRLGITLLADAQQYALEVTDAGVPFNPLEHPEPDTTLPLEERGIGGLGICLVRRMSDRVEYERREGENRVRVTGRLRAT